MFELVDGWSIVRFFHVMGAIIWVGGQLLLTLTVVPVLRGRLDDETRSAIGSTLGRRYALIAYGGALPVLIATGIAQAYHRGVTLDAFTRSGYGGTLGFKIILLVVAVAFAAWHGIAAAVGNERLSRAMAWLGLATSVLIVLLATSLV